jgi:ribosomal protein L34
LPFADTPIIRKNRAMRKASAENNRRSSSGMRGRRASSLVDEGRGHGMFSRFYSYSGRSIVVARREIKRSRSANYALPQNASRVA